MDLKEHGETVRESERNHLLQLLRHIELELEHLPLQLSTLLQFMPTTNSQIGLWKITWNLIQLTRILDLFHSPYVD